MTVVWVSSEAVADPRTGGQLRCQRLLQAVAAEQPVHLVALNSPSDATSLRRASGVEDVSLFAWPSSPLVKRARALRHRWPLYFGWAHNPVAHAEVCRLVDGGATLVADQLNMATYRSPGKPYVLSLHNDEAKLLRETPTQHGVITQLQRHWDERMLAARQAELVADGAAHVVVVSDDDARSIGGRSTVIPNGADLPAATPTVPGDGTLLFVGSMTHSPNELAVRWWASSVWPVSRTRRPLTVVGAAGQEVLADLAGHDGLRILGEVDDVKEHLAKATAVLIPLLHGGGTRLKLLEALAWGRPVVTTAKGAEGLPVRDAEHVLIADTPAAFAAATARVLDDAALRQHLSAQGIAFAAGYSWRDLGAAFARLVSAVGERSSLGRSA